MQLHHLGYHRRVRSLRNQIGVLDRLVGAYQRAGRLDRVSQVKIRIQEARGDIDLMSRGEPAKYLRFR